MTTVLFDGVGNICDFCGLESDAFTDFACASFTHNGGTPFSIRYECAWGACPACAVLVKENRWEELLDRSVKFGIPACAKPLGVEAQVREDLSRLHAEFRKHRLEVH
jgi:hypothetical protein